MIVQITSAIAHLHCTHSIAHRDIKPHNILCRCACFRTIPTPLVLPHATVAEPTEPHLFAAASDGVQPHVIA